MATPQEYTVVANALVKLANEKIALLSDWERSFIPTDKIPAAAGAAAQVAVDALDQYRATRNQQS